MSGKDEGGVWLTRERYIFDAWGAVARDDGIMERKVTERVFVPDKILCGVGYRWNQESQAYEAQGGDKWTPELREAWLSRPCKRCGLSYNNGERCYREADHNSHDPYSYGTDLPFEDDFPSEPPESFLKHLRIVGDK